jgi:hypothetical protein
VSVKQFYGRATRVVVGLLAAAALAAAIVPTAAASTTIAKLVSPDGKAIGVAFKSTGKTARLSFSGVTGETVGGVTSAGTFASNCDVQVSIQDPNGNTISGPVCGGQAGTVSNVTLGADGTYALVIAPSPTVTGSLKAQVTSTGSIHSITPGAPGVSITVAAGATMNFGTVADINNGLLSALATSSKKFTGCPDLRLTLLSGGTTLGQTTVCNLDPAFVDATGPEPKGTYTVRVENLGSASGSTTLSDYSFKHQTSNITPTTSGAVVKVKKGVPGQNVIASFSGTSGQQISATFTQAKGFSGCPSYQLLLVRPNGSTANSVGACGTNNATLPATTLDATGTWSVVVDPIGPATGSGTLTVFLVQNGGGSITPTRGGVAVPINISTPGAVHDETFAGTVGMKISVVVSDASPSLQTSCYQVLLIKPDTSTLLGNAACGPTLFVDPQETTLDQAGTWTIRFQPLNSGTGTATETVYLATDQTGTVTPKVAGDNASVNMEAPGENGRFTFTGSVGQKISVTVSSATPGLSATCYQFYLVKPDGSFLGVSGSSCTDAGFADPFETTLDQAGTWTILFDPFSTGTGTATLTAYLATDQTTTIAPSVGGNSKSVNIQAPGQNARFTFTGSVGQKVSMAVSSATSGLSTTCYQFYLVKPDGSLLGVSGSSCTDAGFADPQETTLDQAGTWTILFDPFGTGTGTATLTAYLATDQTGPIVPSVPGGNAGVTIQAPGQNARFTFTGAVGQKVSLAVSAAASGLQTACYQFYLLKPDGSFYFGNSSCGATGFADPGEFALDQAGTWTVVFDPFGAGTGTATVTAYLATDQTGPITPATGSGGSASVSIQAPGQNGRFTFTGAVGQKIALGVSAASSGLQTSCYQFYLLRPDGTFFGGGGTSCTPTGFADPGEFTLDQAGTWTVFFDPFTTGTGTATLTAYLATDQTGTITKGGATKNVNVSTPGQNARFTFSGTSGDSDTVTITAATFPSSYIVSLVRPDGSTAAAQGFAGATGTLGPVTLDATGTWTILVDPSGTDTGTATVKLS